MIEILKNIAESYPDLILIGFLFLATIVAWFIKRLIGKLENSQDKLEDSIEMLDDRITSLEIKFSKISTFHQINHTGQIIE
jgi:membrane protein implicated in regulation of membrane protease activity